MSILAVDPEPDATPGRAPTPDPSGSMLGAFIGMAVGSGRTRRSGCCAGTRCRPTPGQCTGCPGMVGAGPCDDPDQDRPRRSLWASFLGWLYQDPIHQASEGWLGWVAALIAPWLSQADSSQTTEDEAR